MARPCESGVDESNEFIKEAAEAGNALWLAEQLASSVSSSVVRASQSLTSSLR